MTRFACFFLFHLPTRRVIIATYLDMSASQIPNLNTLRRGGGGGGRGRLRHRGGGGGRAGELGKDRVVQGTDNDASVSRLSAVRLGYLADPFAEALTPPGSETRRMPIINRGKIGDV